MENNMTLREALKYYKDKGFIIEKAFEGFRLNINGDIISSGHYIPFTINELSNFQLDNSIVTELIEGKYLSYCIIEMTLLEYMMKCIAMHQIEDKDNASITIKIGNEIHSFRWDKPSGFRNFEYSVKKMLWMMNRNVIVNTEKIQCTIEF